MSVNIFWILLFFGSLRKSISSPGFFKEKWQAVVCRNSPSVRGFCLIRKREDSGQRPLQDVCLVPSVLLVALSAVDRFTRCWHKRHLRVCAAVGAFDLRHLPRGTVTSILITHFVFHRPYSLVIQKIILASIIGTSFTAHPSSTQVRSPVYCRVRGWSAIITNFMSIHCACKLRGKADESRMLLLSGLTWKC